ncbi:hypothetical protein QTP88_013043 [Uroleucon formosanum]
MSRYMLYPVSPKFKHCILHQPSMGVGVLSVGASTRLHDTAYSSARMIAKLKIFLYNTDSRDEFKLASLVCNREL